MRADRRMHSTYSETDAVSTLNPVYLIPKSPNPKPQCAQTAACTAPTRRRTRSTGRGCSSLHRPPSLNKPGSHRPSSRSLAPRKGVIRLLGVHGGVFLRKVRGFRRFLRQRGSRGVWVVGPCLSWLPLWGSRTSTAQGKTRRTKP